MELFVNSTSRLGGMFAFGTVLMEPILAAPLPGATILQAYITMNASARSPYDILYKGLIVMIIMTKNCGYSSLRTWLAQSNIGPNDQAYPTLSNDLVEMMNSRTFESDPEVKKRQLE